MEQFPEQQLVDDQFYLWVIDNDMLRSVPRITRWVCCRQTGRTATVISRGGKRF